MIKQLQSWYLIDKLNSHKSTSEVYVFLKRHIKKGDFRIDVLQTPTPVPARNNNIRINLLIPSLRKAKVFGGINTALKFFIDIVDRGNFDGRIIVIGNEQYDKKLTIPLDNYHKRNISFQYLNDDLKIEVCENDFFVFTTWKSAYIFNEITSWRDSYYKLQNSGIKDIYLIQDFEPGFVAWSAEYAIAESTYKTRADHLIAVFNSKELYDFFKNNNYGFASEFFFRPALNSKLKEILLSKKSEEVKKEKIIIFYGRPNEPRNAFELIRAGLSEWSKKYDKSKEWKIYSIGAPNKDIKLENNIINCKGKLTIEQYANLMLKAYAGISLMISPHPSYPPLEMSTFGVKTITNNFQNKKLSGFNNKLFCIDECTPEVISDLLIKICDDFNALTTLDINNDYINGDDINLVVKSVVEQIETKM